MDIVVVRSLFSEGFIKLAASFLQEQCKASDVLPLDINESCSFQVILRDFESCSGDNMNHFILIYQLECVVVVVAVL